MFIRYNPGIKLWEYDTSPNQTGIGPWVKLPIDPSQLVSGGGGSNIAFTDAANIFTAAIQQINAANPMFQLYHSIAGVDARRTRLEGFGDFYISHTNDADNAYVKRWVFTRSGYLALPSSNALPFTAISMISEALVIQGGNTSIYFQDMTQPVNYRVWRIMNQSQLLKFYTQDDGESGYTTQAYINRSGDFNARTSLRSPRIIAEGGAGSNSGLESIGNLAVVKMFDAGGPANLRNWRFIQYNNGALYLELCNDADVAQIAPIKVRPDNVVEFPGNYIQLNGGVYFPYTSSNAQVLDDYEEGTWAPRIWGVDGEVTSYSTRTGTYTKVGNIVTMFFDVVIQAANWSGGQPVYMYMPFDTISGGGLALGYWGLNGSFLDVAANVEPGNARCHFPYKASTVSGGIDGYVLTGHMAPGSRLSGTLTYTVAT